MFGTNIQDPTAAAQHWLQQFIEQQMQNIANGGSINPLSGNNPNAAYPDIAQYQNMLGSDPSQFMKLLTSLLQDRNNMQMTDQQWALLNSQLDWLKQQKTNEYNEGLRDEARQYDSPTQQLERLMATGMSRQAALQMLGQGSGGASAGVPYASSPAESQLGLSPSESQLNKVQAATAISGSVFGGLNSLIGLANFGINVPTALATGSIAKAQAIALQNANDAQEKSAGFNALVEYAKRKGFINPSKLSFDDCVSALQKINDSRIHDFFAEGGAYDSLVGSPLGFNIANENYNTRFGSQDAISRIKHTAAMTACANAQADSLVKSIDVQDATIQKIWSDINNTDASTRSIEAKLPYELDALVADTNFKDAQAEVAKQVVRKESATADIIAISAHRMGLTADTYDDIAMTQAQGLLQRAYAENSKEVLESACREIYNNQTYREQIAWFNAVSSQKLHDLKKSNPKMFDEICKWKVFYNEANIGGAFQSALSAKAQVSSNPNFGNLELNSDLSDFLGTFGIK